MVASGASGRFGGAGRWPTLRAYQLETARGILAAVRSRSARTVTVMFSRQAGKNELSAQVELLLLLQRGCGEILKVAPSLHPQGQISMRRLWARLVMAGLAPPAERDGLGFIRLGGNGLRVLSASPGSNVVGHTAGALLECDEAQDVDMERFDRDFRPMTASRASAIVFYGTPWTATSLLEVEKQRNLELEKRDGIRRHFEYDWRSVAAVNSAYAAFAEQERERLGEQHPIWRTQYCLETVDDAGRLFPRGVVAAMAGSHARKRMRDRELLAEVLVAGLDVGGEQLSRSGDRDETVLTVARVRGEPPAYEIVEHLAWSGASHDALLYELGELLGRTWQPQRLCIDATGLGEGLAAGLEARLRGRTVVERLRLSELSKSQLGFSLIAAGPRIRCYAGDGSAEYRRFLQQVERAQARFKANRLMDFFVSERDGHDDYVSSLALCVRAGEGEETRVARGRRGEGWEMPEERSE